MHVLGRDRTDGPAGRLGRYRARDGSAGGPVGLDLAGPHAAVVVGKRGSGKSYTLGVLAEELARVDGIAPVVVDPMGAFGGLPAGVPATVVTPSVPAATLPARAWPALLGLDPEGAPGSLVWRAADARDTLAGMCSFVGDADVPAATRRAAANHLRMARAWDVFAPNAPALTDARVTVVDCEGTPPRPAGAVVRAVADRLYDTRTAGDCGQLPWLLVDEAHAFLDGVAAPALERLLTRGRGPGVSVVLATQRPAALPDVAVSQADLLVSHRLTGREDREALRRARPAYVREGLVDRLPTAPGEALVVDDATEAVHEIRVRERETPHEGASPRIDGMRMPPSDSP